MVVADEAPNQPDKTIQVTPSTTDQTVVNAGPAAAGGEQVLSSFGNYDILTDSMPYRPNLEGRLEEIPGVPAYGNKELLRLVSKQ